MSLYGGADTTAPPSPSFSPLPTPSAGLSDASGFSASSTEPETDASSVDGREPLSAAAAAALRQRKDVGGESTAATAEEDEHLKLYGLDRTDFLWTMTEEPHRSRRLAILKAHPEVRPCSLPRWIVLLSAWLTTRTRTAPAPYPPPEQIKSLMGHTRTTKYLVALVVGVQLSAAILFAVHGVDPLSWRFLLTAYALGGTCNQNLFLAIHEISHNMAFKSITANRLLAMTANLGIGVPYSVVFKVRARPCGAKKHAGLPHLDPPSGRRLTQSAARASLLPSGRSTTSSTTSAWARTASTPTSRASSRPCFSTTSPARRSLRASLAAGYRVPGFLADPRKPLPAPPPPFPPAASSRSSSTPSGRRSFARPAPSRAGTPSTLSWSSASTRSSRARLAGRPSCTCSSRASLPGACTRWRGTLSVRPLRPSGLNPPAVAG